VAFPVWAEITIAVVVGAIVAMIIWNVKARRN
jgi:hypothetical protein